MLFRSVSQSRYDAGHYGEDQYRDEELEIEDDLDPVTGEEFHWKYID